MELSPFHIPKPIQILKQSVEKYGYTSSFLDTFSHALVSVSNGEHLFYAGTNMMYPLNYSTPANIANDKAFTYILLEKNHIRVPQGKHFFLFPEYQELRGAGQEREDAFIYAKTLGYPVFVKPNKGSHGRFAEVMYNEEELRNHLETISKYTYIAHVQELLKGNEYRIFVVDGEIMFSYQRSAQCIVGDGQSSIAELLEDVLENDIPSDFFLNMLKHENLSLVSILPHDKKLPLVAKTNIAAGGSISDIQEVFSPEIQAWAKNIAEITHLRVLGIDIFAPSLKNPKDFVVLEINQNPSLGGVWSMGREDLAMRVWRQILEIYFKETSCK